MKAQFKINSFETISNLDVDDFLPICRMGGAGDSDLDPDYRLNFWEYDAEVEVTNAAGEARTFSICFQNIDHSAWPNRNGWAVCEYDQNSDSIEDVTEFLANDEDAKAFAEWIEAQAEAQAKQEFDAFVVEYGEEVLKKNREEQAAADEMYESIYEDQHDDEDSTVEIKPKKKEKSMSM